MTGVQTCALPIYPDDRRGSDQSKNDPAGGIRRTRLDALAPSEKGQRFERWRDPPTGGLDRYNGVRDIARRSPELGNILASDLERTIHEPF